MRILKNDCTRYMAGDDDDELGEDESGWKLVHGDVFRFPENSMLFRFRYRCGRAAVHLGVQCDHIGTDWCLQPY